jgi:Flp pilus assembly protein TadG
MNDQGNCTDLAKRARVSAISTMETTKQRSILSRLRSLNSDAEGSALVEMALVLPLMMVLILGITSMGLATNAYIILSHATDVGARYIAISQGNFANGANNPCASAATQIQAAAPVLSASKLSYSITLSPSASGTATTYTSSNGGSGFGSGSTCGTGGTAAMGTGLGTVTVTLTYPYQLLFYGRSPTTLTLTASTTEIIQ